MDRAGSGGQHAQVRWLAFLAFAACGPTGGHRSTRPPPADPLFPQGYADWTAGPEPVRDEANEELRSHYRSADARAYVKVHASLAGEVVTGIDVRLRTPGRGFDGWTYVSFDPATRRRLPTDAETCHLCHATAPDGTFTRF